VIFAVLDVSWTMGLNSDKTSKVFVLITSLTSLIPFFMLLRNTKRPGTLTGHNARLFNILIRSSYFMSEIRSYVGLVWLWLMVWLVLCEYTGAGILILKHWDCSWRLTSSTASSELTYFSGWQNYVVWVAGVPYTGMYEQNHIFWPISHFISEMVQHPVIVTTKCQ